jgi:hypothetical protein
MSRQKVMSGKRTPRISSRLKLLLTKLILTAGEVEEAKFVGRRDEEEVLEIKS